MSDRKRGSQQGKRTGGSKAAARGEHVDAAQIEAQVRRSFVLADRAIKHLRRGEAAKAVRDAERAAKLQPDHVGIAEVYVDAAELARDKAVLARALEHMARVSGPDVELLARLAFTYLMGGDLKRAKGAAERARAALPPRTKGRSEWLRLIEHVEDAVAAGPAGDDAVDGRTEAPTRTDGTRRRGPRSGAGASRAGGRRSGDRSTGATRPAAPRQSAASPKSSRSAATPRRGGTRTVRPADPAEDRRVVEPAPDSDGARIATPSASAAPARFEIRVDVAGEVDGLDVLASGSFAAPQEVELAGLAARLRDAESYDRLFAIEQARGLLRFSHQEETARRVLSGFLGRALLADEVGLGKTIEAGLVLSEYVLRGRVQRSLVLAPPSLVGQWREELSSKFDITTRTTEDASFRADPERFWSEPGVVLASLATARSSRQRKLVTAKPWDLVVVDEAHALKNAATESYRLVSRITSRFLLLLTATPVENRIEELYNLVSLIRPGQLGGRSAFLRRFSDKKLRENESTRAEVRALLGEVMVRNTRALSGVRLPPRFARTVLVAAEPAEAELYGHIAAALRALGPGGRTRLLLSLLLQEAGSSPFAVRATLEKLAADSGRSPGVATALAPAIRCAGRTVTTGKAAALLRALDDVAAPAVVFTRFRATLAFLADTLGRAGVAHQTIDGNVPAPLRHQAIDRVRSEGGVLLSTEVGAEGLNLQFCRRIVNFDLPWNPMRIEQRIGRVHRIGQDHPVEVVNLCLAGSIEERILTILDERINLFELVVGEVEMILGYLDDERDFADLVLAAFAHPEEDRRDREFARLADALVAARARYDNVKSFDEGFFRDELGV